jgi:flagellar basal-body rod protein FlgC
MIGCFDITRSALVAQRARMDVIAGNIANAEATHQEDGSGVPYRRRFVTFMTGDESGGPGVRVAEVQEDQSPFPMRYAPEHPDRIRSGPWENYVQLPNVNITMEYVDALEASRAYEANVSMMNVTRQMVEQSLRLLA